MRIRLRTVARIKLITRIPTVTSKLLNSEDEGGQQNKQQK